MINAKLINHDSFACWERSNDNTKTKVRIKIHKRILMKFTIQHFFFEG